MNHREEARIPLTPVYMSNTRATHDPRRIDITPRRRANRREGADEADEGDNKNENLRGRREGEEERTREGNGRGSLNSQLDPGSFV